MATLDPTEHTADIRCPGSTTRRRQTMSCKKTFATLLLGAALAAGAQAQMKVGVISSSTGPTALVGIPQKNTVPLLPKKIGDDRRRVHRLRRRQRPDPDGARGQEADLRADKVDAIIGPSGSPNAMGDDRLRRRGRRADARAGRHATRSCCRWTTQKALGLQDDAERRPDLAGAGRPHGQDRRQDGRLHRHRRRRTATPGTSTFVPMVEKADIKVVANERFLRSRPDRHRPGA